MYCFDCNSLFNSTIVLDLMPKLVHLYSFYFICVIYLIFTSRASTKVTESKTRVTHVKIIFFSFAIMLTQKHNTRIKSKRDFFLFLVSYLHLYIWHTNKNNIKKTYESWKLGKITKPTTTKNYLQIRFFFSLILYFCITFSYDELLCFADFAQ